jgi:hypothetical protein
MQEPLPVNGTIIPQSPDGRLLAKFYNYPVQNMVKTQEEGRPIYEDFVFVEIRIPGDKNTVIQRKVKDEDKERFAPQWARFQSGADQVIGTPLSVWGGLNASQVAELQAMNVTTVEQLAEVSDTHVSKWTGLMGLRTRAKEFIAISKEAGAVLKMQAELEKRDEQISQLQEAVRALTVAVEAKQSSRKAKAHEDA